MTHILEVRAIFVVGIVAVVLFVTGQAVAEGPQGNISTTADLRAEQVPQLEHFAVPSDDVGALILAYESERISAEELEIRAAWPDEDDDFPKEPALLLLPEMLVGGRADHVTHGSEILDPGQLAEQRRRDAVVRLVSAANRSECTGSLLTPSWVLTSAHCMAENIHSIEVGYASTLEVDLDDTRDACWVPRELRTIVEDDNDHEDCAGADDARGIQCDCVSPVDLKKPLPGSDLAVFRVDTPVDGNVVTPLAFGAPPANGSWPPDAADPLQATDLGTLPLVRVAAFGATELTTNFGQGCDDADYPALTRLYDEFHLARDPYDSDRLHLLSSLTRAAPGDSGAPIVTIVGPDTPWDQPVIVGVLKHSDCHGEQYALSALDTDRLAWIQAIAGVHAVATSSD